MTKILAALVASVFLASTAFAGTAPMNKSHHKAAHKAAHKAHKKAAM